VRRRITFSVIAAVLLAVAAYWWLRPDGMTPSGTRLTLDQILGSAPPGFRRAEAPGSIQLPADHGPHGDHRAEWWHFTTTLEDEDERPLAVRLSLFRLGLLPQPPERPSAWATQALYMAHLAVTDAAKGQFLAFQRLARNALGLSGATLEPARIWVEDWQASYHHDDGPAFRLHAEQGHLVVNLRLEPTKPVLRLGGDGRLSAAGAGYAMTRMQASGSITRAGRTLAVTGQGWLDRAWGTQIPGGGQVRVDRFALQLEDGRELLCLRWHRGGRERQVAVGTMIAADGSSYRLRATDLDLRAQDHWRSPVDGTRYPTSWQLRVPAEKLTLEITPYLQDQEVVEALRYWGGAVHVHGYDGDRRITGSGHLELTGYADAAASP